MSDWQNPINKANDVQLQSSMYKYVQVCTTTSWNRALKILPFEPPPILKYTVHQQKQILEQAFNFGRGPEPEGSRGAQPYALSFPAVRFAAAKLQFSQSSWKQHR